MRKATPHTIDTGHLEESARIQTREHFPHPLYHTNKPLAAQTGPWTRCHRHLKFYAAEVRGIHVGDGIIGATEGVLVEQPHNANSNDDMLEPQLCATGRFEESRSSVNCVDAAQDVEISEPNEVIESEKSCSFVCHGSDQPR
jgi:hypothetical protein